MKRGERKGKVHRVTRHYISATCDKLCGGHPGADSHKNWHVCHKISNFCPTFAVHFSGVSDLRPGVKVSVSLLTLLVIVPTSAAVPRILWWIVFLVPNLLSPLSLTDARWAIMTMLRA